MTAFVTDIKYRMALSLIRDLNDNKIKTVGLYTGSIPPFASRSKGLSACYSVPDSREDPAGFIKRLIELCREYCNDAGLPVVLPVASSTLSILSKDDSQAALKGVCRMCISNESCLELANDKARLAEMARKIGVPTPEEYRVTCKEDLENLDYPLIAKPVFGEKQGLPAEKRYRLVSSPKQAIKALEDYTFENRLPVFQKWLAGSGWGYSVLAENGEIINSICHRRIREYPISGGPSTCCVSEDGAFLLPHARKLIKALNFTGLAMIEFKTDLEGNPYLLEINPRIWGTFPLTRVAKSSIAYDWYALAAELEPKRISPKTGVRMYYLPSDARRSLSRMKKGAVISAASAIKDWLSPFSHEGIFELSDLGASWGYLTSYMKGRRG